MARKAEILKLDPRALADIELIARRLSKRRIDRIMKEANQKALTWLQVQAGVNLRDSIVAHGRPQYANRRITTNARPIVGLRKTIASSKSHIVTADSVDFMVDDLVRENAPQYHILEEGYGGFVGKEAPIGFRSRAKNRGADPGRYPNDAALRGQGKVTIKRAIRGYHYAAKTVDQFLDQEIFEGILERAVSQLRSEMPGLQIEIFRGPKAKQRSFR